MALINCPECQKNVSSFASACPHCGYPVDGFTKEKEILLNKENNCCIGSVLNFGKYRLKSPASGEEAIEWVVAHTIEKYSLLICKYCIDYQQYGVSCRWEESYIRKWLNSDFFSKAFDDIEKSKIVPIHMIKKFSYYQKFDPIQDEDKVFLISRKEVLSYSKIITNEYSKCVEALKYKRSIESKYIKGIDNKEKFYPLVSQYGWWLRTSTYTGYPDYVCTYKCFESERTNAPPSVPAGIRPAMWIDNSLINESL